MQKPFGVKLNPHARRHGIKVGGFWSYFERPKGEDVVRFANSLIFLQKYVPIRLSLVAMPFENEAI
jgi:hypothetical protein